MEQLQKKFDVNERSIQRDVRLLKEAGAFIGKVGDGYFYVDKDKE